MIPVARLRAVPRPSRLLLIALAVLVLAILAPGIELLRFGGAFRSMKPELGGNCRAIEMGGSVRDIRIDRERGVAYLSFLDRDTATSITGNGTVVLLDLNLADPAPRAAMSRDPQGFRPEGISLLKQAGQPARLFAVSRVEGRVPAVEFLEQDPNGAFVPTSTAREATFGTPGLVAALGPGRILVTDHRPSQGFQRKLSLLTRSGDDAIVFRDGARSTVVEKALAWVSGLALSADGSHLYVAETLKQRLLIYRLDASALDASAVLTLERTVALDTPPAGLDVDADRVIWIATHPALLRYFSALEGSGEPVPTRILRFDPRQPAGVAVPVFADDGSRISSGTIAAHWRDELLIGAPLDQKVLICKLNP
jgi:hypothetical protein